MKRWLVARISFCLARLHALWAFDESERARSHHDIVARKAGGHDIGFATLEAIAGKDELTITARAREAEQGLVFPDLAAQ